MEPLASLSSTRQYKARFARLDAHVTRMSEELRESSTSDDASDPSCGGAVALPHERFTDAELERF
ncbi:hypothetical protein A5664_18520 [Mycolicibacterium fortuitum]|nr:hypothetical protein A5664_18520 [Mycolicibacterium fortuitum]